VLISAALVVSGCAPALAQTPQQPAGRALTVSGQGTVSVKPDLALASLGVETLAGTVAEASQKNNATMAAIMAKLAELKIPDKDIQTSGFSINSFSDGMPRAASDGGTGTQYRVSNMVQVKIREIEQVSAVLDGVISAGANQVYGVNFTVEDPNALQSEARAKAVEDAAQRAAALAKLAKVQLGQVMAVIEGGGSSPIFGGGVVYGRGAAAADSTPMSPGEVEVSYQVQVTYAIQ